jgi:hypothetical protein
MPVGLLLVSIIVLDALFGIWVGGNNDEDYAVDE